MTAPQSALSERVALNDGPRERSSLASRAELSCISRNDRLLLNGASQAPYSFAPPPPLTPSLP